ncbi:unnamed protein product [Eruca vesicaria subsp. sativa]|uniref:QLQ domain-containing protein n=1 Tax=Eruca vesicaria subsp. sativa TaxID=29727 RepID=A0ABC8KI13_ERUVS|nr:unnamed protein product [Eruca vesicaria subsp. sativa]
MNRFRRILETAGCISNQPLVEPKIQRRKHPLDRWLHVPLQSVESELCRTGMLLLLHSTCLVRGSLLQGHHPRSKQLLGQFYMVYCLGGNEPRLVSAAVEQLKTLPFYHSFWNRTTKPSLDLAKDLLNMFTANKMAKAFLTNSGSEANDNQVKLVWYYNNALGRLEKKKFIARKKSYHGSTLISASLSGYDQSSSSIEVPMILFFRNKCNPFYFDFNLGTVCLGETEEEFSTRLAKNLEDLIIKEGPETIMLASKYNTNVFLLDWLVLFAGGVMGRSMSEKAGAAFSEAQWQELERQRNIFKY